MTDAELAFRMGNLFDRAITDVFWDSFKGEFGRTQSEVLVYLYNHEQARASDIAESLNISKQHVSKAVATFMHNGYVRQCPYETDKRANSLELTQAGKTYLEEHFALSNASFEQLVGRMAPGERERFLESMDSIVKILSNLSVNE